MCSVCCDYEAKKIKDILGTLICVYVSNGKNEKKREIR